MTDDGVQSGHCLHASGPGPPPGDTIVRMSEHRVPAPAIAPGEQPKGPASYFPSIERSYGRAVQDWLDLAADRLDDHPHMEVVAWLKSEHGLGHGHANAIVAYAKAVLAG